MKKEMTPDIYTKRRDELLEILEPASGYAELDMESREAFRRSIRKLQSESFEIVLVGEFQGGKSSTFNAICDGRNISPIGSGIKTSACKISAQNIVDPDEKERAVIRWKTDDELILTMLDILKHQMTDDEFQRISVRDNGGHFVNISLSDPQDVRRINECLAREWEVYKTPPAGYDRDLTTEKLDLLYVSSLIMHFYNDLLIKDLRKETLVTTIEKMQPYVVFPTDWATRWGQKTPTAFESKDIVLAFIADVHCYIHSPNLRRLGCIITDSPGLFAGPWDTKVAIEAMLNADAILYLLPGEKTIGMNELGALKHIQRTNQFHKVFFAMNARVSYEHLRDCIRPANASTINNCLGQDTITPEAISIFNALLAYNAKHHPYINGEQELMYWRRKTKKTLETFLNLDAEDDTVQLGEYLANPETISETCKYEELLDIIETTVVQKKACSLLYVNGVLPINTALEELEGDLKKREDNARSDYQNAEQEARKAKEALEEFKRESTKVVEEELGDPGVRDVLSDDFIRQVYLERTGAIASNIMGNIEILLNDSRESFRYIVDMIKRNVGVSVSSDDEKGFALTIKGYVSQSIKDECLPAASGWLVNLSKGNNAAYKVTVGSKLNSITFRINQIWKDLILSAPEGVRSYFLGLKPGNGTGDAAAGITKSFDGSGLLEEIRGSMLKMLGANIVAVIAGALGSSITAFVAAFILGAIFNPAGLLLIALVALAVIAGTLAGVKLSDWLKEKFSQKIRDNISRKLKPELDNAFRKPEIQCELKDSANQVVQEIINAHKKVYMDDLKRLSKRFQERYDEVERNRKMSKTERLAVAEHAKKVRMELAKFRAPIVQFIDSVRPYFAEKME
ncbi:MAG: dynamin family protein [Planctomycetia bacterium]|nr:dynamin family protein [Planctomycetia bacterium]